MLNLPNVPFKWVGAFGQGEKTEAPIFQLSGPDRRITLMAAGPGPLMTAQIVSNGVPTEWVYPRRESCSQVLASTPTVGGRRWIRWDRTRGRPEPVLALDRIPEKESGEPLVDLREVAPHVVIVRPQTIPFCRLTVARMVADAGLRLQEKYRLGVTDAWRPRSRQVRIYEWMSACAAEAFPERGPVSLRRTVNRWVAPPDRKAPPGHCTGAAVDVVLLDQSGEVVDVSAPYERFVAAPTYSLGLTEEAHMARMVLVEAMLGAGFSNCRDEWWHYSYGDAGWAVRTGAPDCLYGEVSLPPELFAEQELIAEQALRERTNPFLS